MKNRFIPDPLRIEEQPRKVPADSISQTTPSGFVDTFRGVSQDEMPVVGYEMDAHKMGGGGLYCNRLLLGRCFV